MSEYRHVSDLELWDARKKECKPIFKMKPQLMTFKSKEAGREIWEDHEFLEIIIPGDSKSRVSRPVRQDDIDRWPEQYRAFKEGVTNPGDGQILQMLPGISESQIKMLEFQNVRTIEDLADLADGQLQNIGMGGLDLRKKARRMVLATSDSDKFNQFEGLAEENETLKAQMADLMAKVDAMAEPKKRRGRPTNAEIEARKAAEQEETAA